MVLDIYVCARSTWRQPKQKFMCYWPKLSVTVRAMVDQNQFKLYSPEADSLYGPPEPDYILVQSPEQLKLTQKCTLYQEEAMTFGGFC